jgi:hypothetical protein
MNGLWLLPSRRRPGSLKGFFEAACATSMSTGGVVLIHKDDWDELREQYEAIKLPPEWHFYLTEKEGYAGKVQEVLASGELNDLDWVGILADDLVPETYQWDVKLIQMVNGFNIVAANDGYQAPKRANGALIYSRELLSAVGYFAPPGMSHLFVDDIWETLGRDTGCITWAMGIMVRHRNAAITGAMDDTVAKVKSYWPNDEAVYRKWTIESRKAANEAIFALVEKHGVKVFRPDLKDVSLLVSVPSHDGKYEAEFVRSLIGTKDLMATAGAYMEVAELTYCADIALARSRIFGVFLRSKHTHMLMIDADMGWVPQDVLRLFEHGHDFVCAAGPKKKYPLEFAFESATEDGQAKPMRTGADGMTFEVTGVGMAFTMITRACAEKMAAAYGDLTFEVDNGVVEYGVFDPLYLGKKRLSEDYSFCRRWTATGGKIHMLPHIRLKHVGPHTFEGCLMDDLLARVGRTAA